MSEDMKLELMASALNPVELINEVQRLHAENARLAGEVEELKKQAKIDNEGNQDWINSLCEQLCKMEDALGFKNDAYDKKGQWVPTIGPWLERLRDLLAAEGELGDTKEALEVAKDALQTVSEEIGDMASLLMESEEQEDSTLGKAWRALIKQTVVPALAAINKALGGEG